MGCHTFIGNSGLQLHCWHDVHGGSMASQLLMCLLATITGRPGTISYGAAGHHFVNARNR